MLTPESDALLQSDIIGWEKTWRAPNPRCRGARAAVRSGQAQYPRLRFWSSVVLWWIAAKLALVSPVFLPGPAAVLQQAIAVTRDGYVNSTLLQHVVASLGRVLAALVRF